MTIQAATARVSFPCDSVSNVFPVNIQAYLATDFLVLLTNAAGSTKLNLNSDYTLVASGSLSPPFWSLTTQTGQFVSPYVTGNTLQVILNPSETQLTQYTQGQAFPSLAVQTNLDRLTQMVIREGDQLLRAITAPDGDVSPMMLLPVAALRASTNLGFDLNGNIALNLTLASGTISTATLAPFLNLSRTAAEISAGVTPTNYSYPFGNLLRYGCDLTGATDSTTQFQNAATAVGVNGGILFHPGGTVMINKTVKLSSNTILQGVGKASLIKANPTYIGVNGGSYIAQNCHMIGNLNYGAVALTDTDIVVRDVAFDWGSVVIAGGGAFSISFHFVTRVFIENVYSNSGDNVTALLSCLDTVTFNCHGYNCRNAYFDDWGGASSIKVLFCTGRTTVGTTAQGIQFTGLGSFGDAGQATNAVVAFCELYGIKSAGGTSSALICNANAAGSSTARFKTFGNHIENCDNGWVAQGALGQALSIGDVFNQCKTGSPIFFNTDASGAPADCRVINPTLIDCNHLPGNIAMIVIQGTNNRVEGIKCMSPGGVLYTEIVWFPAAAVNCYAHIEAAPSGTGGARIFNQSTTSLVKDLADLDAWPYSGALPTIASAATIAPTLGVTFVSGAVNVVNITVPIGCLQGGAITLISTGTWNTTAAGNIALATTVTPGRPLTLIWNPFNAKWYPSY